MIVRDHTDKEKLNMHVDGLALIVITVWTFLVNAGIRISGLYLDDLYMWSCFGEQSFREFVFPLGSTRFRPVFWFISWLELGGIKNHLSWIVPINIIFAALIAGALYFFLKKLSSSRLFALIGACVITTSRFAYYDIAQLLGLMETLALALAIGICYCLYRYVTKSEKLSYYIALLLYVMVSFTHERFMVLLPMFFFCLMMAKSKDVTTYITPVLAFIGIQLIRILTIGTALPAGTGGTEVADTLSASGIIYNIRSQILFLLGINTGPKYLCGILWSDTAWPVRVIVILTAIITLVLFIIYIYVLIAGTKKETKDKYIITMPVFFLGFIIGCVVASAVTIRVEMRWVYSSYVFVWILAAYMYGCVMKQLEETKDTHIARYYAPLSLIVLAGICMLISEGYYRTGFKDIYLFPEQKRYNSLADETYGIYGDEIFGKTIYLVGNQFNMSEFTDDTFFKVFDRNRQAAGTEVIHIDTIYDIGQIRDNMLVIAEDKDAGIYHDVTAFVRDLKCHNIYGYYPSDGWMDQEAEIEVMSGKQGEIVIRLLFPGNLNGGEQVAVSVDGEETKKYNIKENVTTITLYGESYSKRRIHMSYNFIMPDALEVRGDTPLATVVEIESQ